MNKCIEKGINFQDTGFSYSMSLISGKYKFKTLTSNLKALEDCGLIIRKEYQEIPPKVEYYLSEKGKSLMPILEQLCEWGEKNKQEI